MHSPDPFGWVGSTIDGQFAVEAIAGEGGFGIVYRGTHLGLEVPVAIKCLNIPRRLSEAEQESFLAKFRAEARLLHRLSSQTANIVQALDIGAATAPTGQWTPYIVMEWLEGETLERNIDARRKAGGPPQGLDAAIRVLRPAAEALGIAHRDNVSHRDVKPANLFLWRSSGNSGMKVLDFGIAKVFSETPSLSLALALTSDRNRAFTPSYGAPEQFSLTYGATGPWTDVFAMALILIEVASGRRVLQGDTIVDLLITSVEAHQSPDLLQAVTSNDAEVGLVLRRALTVNPAHRFQSMDAFWSALDKASRIANPLGNTVSSDVHLDSPIALPGTATAQNGPAETHGALAAPSPAAMGENRVCTVMLVDFSSVAALSSRLDAEELEDIFGRFQRVVTEHVESLGGVVERFAGDCVIAVFGVPRAADGDAERAVLAALRIQAALGWVPLPRAARAAHLSATTIGINTGRVFARMGTAPGRSVLTVVGEVVSAAARIRQAAPAGQIVIGRDTYRQITGRFNVEPLAPVSIPGREEAVPCYRVASVIAFGSALASTDFHGVETHLLGRAGERQRLVDALETSMSERRARLVTMVGGPGVGRSRLLADFFSGLAARVEGVVVLTAQCSPLAQDTSYGLTASLLRRRFDIRVGDSESTIRRRLRRGLRWFRRRTAGGRGEEDGLGPPRDEDAAELDAALTTIEGVLGVGTASSTTSIALDDSGGMAKQRIAAAASLLVRFAAQRMPIVLLCDDLQWADDGSLDLLRDLVRRGDDLPLLIVGSARPELLERRPDWGLGGEAEERVPIAPLSRRHVEEMVRDRLRRIPALSPELLRVLTDRAEGNPLILEETLHLLVDAGVIEARGDEAWVFREERLGALALPANIQGIVQSRLDRLKPELREALAQAAVVGRTFWEGSLQHLRQATPNAAPGPSANALMHELRDRQLIRVRDRATLPGEREAIFAESATHEVVYEMLTLRIRRPLHLLVAGWLEQRATSSAGAALLAMHYDRGGDDARAVAAYSRAAAHAASLGENAEAIRHLGRASAILDEERDDGPRSPGDHAETDQLRIVSSSERVRLRLDLGDALRRAGRLDEAERAYDEARERVLRVERRTSESMAPGEALRWDARIDAHLALVHKVRGEISQARALIERAIARATEAGAAEETPAMYALLTFLLRRDGRPEESWQVARRGLRICRSISRRDERWQENVAQLLLGVAAAAYARKRYVTAERTYRQIARLASEATHPHVLGAALNGVGAARHARGDLKGAREAFLRSMRFKERAGDLHPIAVGYNNLAEVELRLKETTTALDHARRAVRLGEQARAGSDLADFYRNLAEAALAAGELAAALDAGRKALGIAEEKGRLYLGDVAITLARAVAHAAQGSKRGTILHQAALEAAAALRASLAEHFNEGELREKAEECRKLLGPMSTNSDDAPAIGPS